MSTSTDVTFERTAQTGTEPETIALRDDHQLAYAEYGSPDGSPVVILHGIPGSRRFAELFVPAARSSGIRLLAPDRPGYGRSTPQPTRSVQESGRILAEVLNDAGGRSASIIAFSGGAPYGLGMAASSPELVDRIDIISGATPPSISDATPGLQRVLSGLATTTPRLLAGLFRGQAWLASRLDPSFVVSQYTADNRSGNVPATAAEIIREDLLEAFARSHRGAVTEFQHAGSGWNLDFGEISVDVCLRHGTEDTNVPLEDARRFASHIPGARLSVLEGADHLGTLLRSIPQVMENNR